MTKKGYFGVSLPDSLGEQIQEIIDDRKYGYTTRADFIRDAIRLKLKQINENKTN